MLNRFIRHTTILCTLEVLAAAATTSMAAPAPFEELAPVRLYAAAAPGTEEGRCPERTAGKVPDRIVYNVSVPTYRPFLPPAARSTGTAVIVAPGGWLPVSRHRQ